MTTARRGKLLIPAAVAIAVAALAGGCRSGGTVPEPGAILLRVDLAAGAPTPDELRVYVYDDTGILWSDVREPAQGPLVPESAQTLGTILIQPGESTGTLRIEVRGLASGVWILDGLLEVAPPERAQGTFVVVLGSMLPPDGDGDGVPDPIDDCPAVPDPQQKGCSSPTDGGVDAGPDAGPDGGPICGDGGCAPQGAACTSNTSCASGFCADGVCCANDCAGTCRSCNQPASNGLCLGYPLGTDPEMECTTGMTCNGAGACGKAPPPTSKANGELCGAAGECMSGFCTDGVCCNSACNAPCQSCSTGACQAVKSGQDVPECVSPKTCNSHGSCVQSGG
jgi:hypothetical protein